MWGLYLFTNAQFSQGESQLYIFEDNEAMIKMISQGRSPTMRHLSRTHRVALDWLLDRINLDPKIKIIYVGHRKPTRRHVNQGYFTRDEWDGPSSSDAECHEVPDVLL